MRIDPSRQDRAREARSVERMMRLKGMCCGQESGRGRGRDERIPARAPGVDGEESLCRMASGCSRRRSRCEKFSRPAGRHPRRHQPDRGRAGQGQNRLRGPLLKAMQPVRGHPPRGAGCMRALNTLFNTGQCYKGSPGESASFRTQSQNDFSIRVNSCPFAVDSRADAFGLNSFNTSYTQQRS
jgi:hypothetical protein